MAQSPKNATAACGRAALQRKVLFAGVKRPSAEILQLDDECSHACWSV